MEVTLIVALFGLVFGGIGAYLWLSHSNKKKTCTEQVTGTVVGMQQKISTDSGSRNRGRGRTQSVSYYPEYEYVAGGNTYRKVSSVGSGGPRFATGQSITVFCNPADYNKHYIGEDKMAGFIGPIFAGVGALVIIIAFLLLLFQ